MALIAKSRDDVRGGEHETVPPLFASLFSDTPSVKADGRAVDRALDEAMGCLEEDCYVGALGKFREAWTLSSGCANLREKVHEAAISTAESLVEHNWRVAEALLLETTSAADELWAEIANRKRADSIQFALDDAGRVDRDEYLPHVRKRLAEMVGLYPAEARLESRLEALDALLAERVAEDREKNLRRLYLFSDRLDYSENAETLRRFPELVAPFADAYRDNRDFAAVFDEVSELRAALEQAEALLEESRTRECLKVCNDALEKRPNNILFRRLEERAKGREWVSLLAHATVDRARAFEAQAHYAEALGEWESLRGISPNYPGLESEILNCAALNECSGGLRAKEQVAEPVQGSEFVVVADDEAAEIEPLPSFVDRPRSNSLPLGIRISMTGQAWNHFKTGLVATGALLLVVLVLASNSRP